MKKIMSNRKTFIACLIITTLICTVSSQTLPITSTSNAIIAANLRQKSKKHNWKHYTVVNMWKNKEQLCLKFWDGHVSCR